MEPTDLHRDIASGLPEFSDPPTDPLTLLQAWFARAASDGVREPLVASLATVADDGAPSSRFVALKDVTDAGLIFATSADSPKGRAMTADPRVALNLYWPETMQQIRVRGTVERLDVAGSDRLFQALPRAAQATTIVSRQSLPLGADEELREAAQRLERSQSVLARPNDWCGWCLTPGEVEFWVASRDRLHRRLRYQRVGDHWAQQRLQP